MSTLTFEGTLTARTALHIGGGRGSDVADQFIRRTASGDVFIPGSALAGALRAVATVLAPRLGGGVCKALADPDEKTAAGVPAAQPPGRTLACNCLTCRLFGSIDPQEDNRLGGRASRLWVADAKPLAAAPTHVRDAVGIDRSTNAAARAASVKFDFEVMQKDVCFSLRLQLEEAGGAEQQLLAAVLAEWQAGRASIGGRAARGLGAFSLTGLVCCELQLDTVDKLMAFLKEDQPIADQPAAWLAVRDGWLGENLTEARKKVVAAPKDVPVARSWLDLTFDLTASGAFLVNAITLARQAGVDHAPLWEGGALLPGASLRGVLRSHAERIVRTLAMQRPSAENLACPACHPTARTRKKAEPLLPLECCDSRLRQPDDPEEEVDPTHLCLACRLFGSARRGSRLLVEDAPCVDQIPPIFKVQDFLAIDRFTGGGRDSAKFDAVALWRPSFRGRIRLDNPEAWELGWLVLTLRDLAEGRLTAGFGRAKGFGEVCAYKWHARLGYLQAEDSGVKPTLLKPQPGVDTLFQVLHLDAEVVKNERGRAIWRLVEPKASDSAWLEQARSWVRDFLKAVSDYKEAGVLRDPGGPVPDSYFGQPGTVAQSAAASYRLSQLYPREVRP